MKSQRLLLPATLLLLMWTGFAGYVGWTAPHLPARVATHFALSGEPNGWMTRAGLVRFALIAGAAVPAFVLGVFALVRRCEGWGLNIPNKEFWLAPQRRQETFDFIQRQGFWFAGLLIAFFAALHCSIVAANARSPAALAAADIGAVAGGFLVVSAIWAAVSVGRFFRRPA